MKRLEVCFVGVGSIAKRHIKNLVRVAEKNGFDLVIDAVRRNGSRDNDAVSSNIRNIFCDISEISTVYDVAFITNPTELHIETINNITPYARHFFIEKPISSIKQLEVAARYKCKDGSVYYVACPLRYNAVIQYLKENIKVEDVFSVRSISSSYLPDWRPGTDYRTTYSAHKELGGGVSIDLVHEWDYLSFLFGKPLTVKSMIGKKSNLEINSDDYAIYVAEYEDKIVELHLDYFGRKTIREVMLFTKDDTIIGDIANNKIRFLKENKEVVFNEERDDFQIRELEHFIKMIEFQAPQDSDIEHAIDVLKLTQGEC